MAQRPRQARNDGVRELLIAYREYRLPKSTPPPRWSAPMGRPDPLLDGLKAGKAVPLDSSVLVSAYMAAGLPEAAYRRFGFGGADAHKLVRLDEQGRLSEMSDDEYDRLTESLDGV